MSRPDPDIAAVRRLALPDPDLDLAVEPASIVVTPHAVRRYRERIEGVPDRLAERRLRGLVATARWRARPGAWPQVVLRPGVVYGYSEARPDACLLMRGRVLITVLVRERCPRDRGVRTGGLPRPRSR